MTQEAAAPTLREALTDEWLADLFDKHVGDPTPRYPWNRKDFYNFARATALAARPADPVEPKQYGGLMAFPPTAGKGYATPAEPSSRERWNVENPGELSLHTFDDDATPALPKEPTARPRTSPSGAQEMCGRDV